MKNPQFKFEYANTTPFISAKEFEQIQSEINQAHQLLTFKTGAGNDFLGWLDLPYADEKLITKIKDMAQKVIDSADAFVSIGIGGSYLGARAVIEALQPARKVKIYFAGQNIDSTQINNLLTSLHEKNFWLNVISKSGTTLEPALAFRIIKNYMEELWGKEETRKRIIATTDKQKGALKKLADIEAYQTFDIPDDVGGRFSVLTPVGLLPIAIAGIDIDELLSGAKDMAGLIDKPNIQQNPSYMYAAIRTILYRKGKTIETLASFNPALYYFTEWWKQLFGESEGKNNKGIFQSNRRSSMK